MQLQGQKKQKASQAVFWNFRKTFLAPPYLVSENVCQKLSVVALGYWQTLLSLVAPVFAWFSPVASQLKLGLGMFFSFWKETQNKPGKQTVKNLNRSQKESHIVLKTLLAINGIIT